MAEDGTPIAYSAVARGTPLVTRSGRQLGTVEHVLDIPEEDLFDGSVAATEHGLRFVDRDQVDQITTASGRCALTDEQAAALPAQPARRPLASTRYKTPVHRCTIDSAGCSVGPAGLRSRNRWRLLQAIAPAVSCRTTGRADPRQ